MATPELDSHRKVKSIKSANSANYKESPTTHWANAVAMLAAKNKAEEGVSNKQLPEDFSASDIDIIRARALSREI